LPCFRDIAGFLLRTATPPLLNHNFRGRGIGQIAEVGAQLGAKSRS